MWVDNGLLDPVVVRKLGDVEAATLQGIASICHDALVAILGEEIVAFLSRDQMLAERAVPWIWDLAAGLHYQSVRGPKVPVTVELVDEFSDAPLLMTDRNRLADGIDWAVILTEDRIAQSVDGRDAIRADPIERHTKFPWYDRLLLGYRIRLTTEALRLLQHP